MATVHGWWLLRLVTLLSSLSAVFSQGTPTLFPNQTLSDGQLLVSANKTFALGFFSPGGSPNRYLGIWYHNLPNQTVVWIANRESPIPDSSGYVTFDPQGNLIILDSIGSSIMVASNSGSTTTTTATILDSGNLVLRVNKSVLWESFDNPTDTLLPDMKLGMNGKKNRLVTSWTGPQDPSPGEFSVGINPNGTKQFCIWRRGTVYWTSGVWDGHEFTHVSQSAAASFRTLGYVVSWSGGYYSYHFKNNSIISREVIDYSGQMKRLTWLEGKWVEFSLQQGLDYCEIPDYCGLNGLCSRNSSSQPCRCLSGFKPSEENQWELGKFGDGCTRELPLKCGNEDQFLRLTNVTLPYNLTTANSSVSLAECKAYCISNCSCTAYASRNGSDSTGCLLWSGNLTGLQESSDRSSQILYVRIVDSELNQSTGRRREKLILIAIPVICSAIILVSVFICYFRRHKLSVLIGHFEGTIKHEEGEKDCSLFSFATIAAATNNFSSSNKLGEGGFGPVYKAVLEGEAAAVKRLSKSSGQGVEEFKNEIALISKLQHTNLVRLLGYCIEKQEKMLIYEYMPNKSLDSYIFDPVKGAQLDWRKRFAIVEGIAQGLLYLHKYSRLMIIHRDLKASNILLDSEMKPKISDFGMARIIKQGDDNQANTQRVVGTYGYMSPEYAINGTFSVKSDVFSFGVLLLEIVTGKKNSAFQHSESSATLLGYAWKLWKEGRGLMLTDELLGNGYSSPEVLRCIQVALLCVQESASDRPTMSRVVSMLHSEYPTLSTPKQPAFSIVRVEANNSEKTFTCNSVTMTTIAGR